jgi:hypothetical protein
MVKRILSSQAGISPSSRFLGLAGARMAGLGVSSGAVEETGIIWAVRWRSAQSGHSL